MWYWPSQDGPNPPTLLDAVDEHRKLGRVALLLSGDPCLFSLLGRIAGRFPSGDYEFLHNRRDLTGGYKACSLFSPMGEFASQMQAVDVARAVMAALFDPAAVDRLDDLSRPMTPAPAPAPPATAPVLQKARALERRSFITGRV